MKIIDLLNKIANGEKIPQKIKWGCHEFTWFVYDYKAFDEYGEPTLLQICNGLSKNMLNEEVEIIEENTKVEPLKIEQDTPSSNFYIRNEHGTKCGLTKHSKMIAEKVNELVREINKMKKD